MHHLFLSPHYDDAVYSCGGTIASLTAAGDPVTVLTVCAGTPPSHQLSPFAAQLHARWGLPDPKAVEKMISIRLKEDQTALEIVGATGRYLNVTDCIYRQGGKLNEWLYAGEEGLFGQLSGSESGLIADIARSMADCANRLATADASHIHVVAPLAIGNHVDHQLVRRAAEHAFGAETLTYYQDFPYALDRKLVLPYENSADWQSSVTPLDESAIEKKVAAVAAYESQISTFWENKQVLADEVKNYVGDWENGELYWALTIDKMIG